MTAESKRLTIIACRVTRAKCRVCANRGASNYSIKGFDDSPSWVGILLRILELPNRSLSFGNTNPFTRSTSTCHGVSQLDSTTEYRVNHRAKWPLESSVSRNSFSLYLRYIIGLRFQSPRFAPTVILFHLFDVLTASVAITWCRVVSRIKGQLASRRNHIV